MTRLAGDDVLHQDTYVGTAQIRVLYGHNQVTVIPSVRKD
jgi:hypothetical protein